MQLACPSCGTREVRVAGRKGVLELVKGLFGAYPLRCKRCRARWLTSVWESSAWKFARCPRCYRQELSTWSEQYYNPRRSTLMLLRLGAAPYRCPACRCNFASFKACKDKFAWRHETKIGLPDMGLEEIQEAPEMLEVPEHEFVQVGALGPLDVLPAPSPGQSRGVPVVSLKHRDMQPVDPFAELDARWSSDEVENEPEPFL